VIQPRNTEVFVTEELKQELICIFGERVAFHEIERILYSSDIGTLPRLIENQIRTTPEAVVQPNDSEQLIALLGVAGKYNTPVIPRGAGTSGYGGVVPTRGGIVVDFYWMNKIIDIDKGKKTVTVEPGVVWNDLEAELNGHGLALRLYPSSAISATVGGWLASGGGVGIGNFQYGYFGDNVLEVEIITPTGTKLLTEDDIYLVDGMAGTTGFISRVTLPVREKQKDIPILATFPALENVKEVFGDLSRLDLPLWEVSFKDPSHVRLASEAVERQEKRAPIPRKDEMKGLKPPDGRFVAMFVYPEDRDKQLKDKLISIIKAHAGELLGEELARFEWDERFYQLRLKALGPSIIPSEVVVAGDKLPLLVEKIKKQCGQFAYSGTLINRGSEIAVLTYALDDERRRGFPFAFSTSLLPIKEAKKLAGKPYAIGMYLTDEAEPLFGKEKLHQIYEFKKRIDTDGIMNPGKIFPPSLEKNSPIKKLALMTKLAKVMHRVVKVTDKIFGGTRLGEVVDQKTVIGNLPFGKELAWDAFACTNCGYCRSVCREFGVLGWESASPRGKFKFIKEYLKDRAKFDQRIAEMFSICTMCLRCDHICHIKAHIDDHWSLTARPAIWKEGYEPPVIWQTQAHNAIIHHSAQGLPQNTRKTWVPPDIRYTEEGEIGLFVGCSSSFDSVLRYIPVNAVRILNNAGIEPAYLGNDEWCCGSPLNTIGAQDEFLEMAEHNIREFLRRGIKTLVTTCPGCHYALIHFYPLFARKSGLEYDVRVRHIIELIADLIDEGGIRLTKPIPVKVTYHDSCHLGRGGGLYEQPRKILKAIPGVEFVEMPRNSEDSACCGKHDQYYPRIAVNLLTDRLKEAEGTGAQALVANCPTCESNFKLGIGEMDSKLELLNITDLVAASMGLSNFIQRKLGKLAREYVKIRR
jgi:Fe-S oxidoreductase/FAD/FMN-containing dehydrogenase